MRISWQSPLHPEHWRGHPEPYLVIECAEGEASVHEHSESDNRGGTRRWWSASLAPTVFVEVCAFVEATAAERPGWGGIRPGVGTHGIFVGLDYCQWQRLAEVGYEEDK